MARISVWFVRASLLHFALGATVGAWGLAAKSGLRSLGPLLARPLHVEVMLVGWVCQLAVGVALWILPFSGGVSRDRRFWVALVGLNVGLLLVVSGQWSGSVLLILLGRTGEIGAAGVLVWGLWPRLRALPGHSHT